MHSTLANGLACGKGYNEDVLTTASSPKHHVYCLLCNVHEMTCMRECRTDGGTEVVFIWCTKVLV